MLASPSRPVRPAFVSSSRLQPRMLTNRPFSPLPSGVDGVDVVIGTSSFLREFSHGKDMAYIEKTALEGMSSSPFQAFRFVADLPCSL